MASSLSAAGGRESEGVECAAVDKIKGKRKPVDFIGHRERKYAGLIAQLP